MSSAGPPDNPTGEESEGIHYFDFSEPFASEEADPFASEDPSAEETPEGRRLAGEQGTRVDGPREASPRDAFESALSDLPSRAASAGRSGAHAPPFTPLTDYFGRGEQTTGQRARFVDAFDAARMWAERPFLAVALRMPAGASESAWFPLVEQGVRRALRRDDTLLVDRERLRLVAVLPGRGAEAARPLFADLVAYLREHATNAAAVSHRISVFAAPDGQPFEDGASFLAHVYDKR